MKEKPAIVCNSCGRGKSLRGGDKRPKKAEGYQEKLKRVPKERLEKTITIFRKEEEGASTRKNNGRPTGGRVYKGDPSIRKQRLQDVVISCQKKSRTTERETHEEETSSIINKWAKGGRSKRDQGEHTNKKRFGEKAWVKSLRVYPKKGSGGCTGTAQGMMKKDGPEKRV